jgi:dimethylargininase
LSTALVRGVPDCFADALTSREARLDATIAREQHASYVQALEEGGFDVRVVPADPDHPDCSFIEDTAIVYRGRALLTRPGHRSRRGEVAAVALALGELVPVEPFGDSGGTLDGGDVLRVGDLVLVGMSRRTNRAGVSRVAEFALPLGLKVQAVPGSVRSMTCRSCGIERPATDLTSKGSR